MHINSSRVGFSMHASPFSMLLRSGQGRLSYILAVLHVGQNAKDSLCMLVLILPPTH
jgi:hypothetical protein